VVRKVRPKTSFEMVLNELHPLVLFSDHGFVCEAGAGEIPLLSSGVLIVTAFNRVLCPTNIVRTFYINTKQFRERCIAKAFISVKLDNIQMMIAT